MPRRPAPDPESLGITPDTPPAEAPASETRPAWPELTDTEKEAARQVAGARPLCEFRSCGQVYVLAAFDAPAWKALLTEFTASAKDGVGPSLSDQDETVCRHAVVWPRLPEGYWSAPGTLAGLPASIAATVRARSGFPVVLEDGRLAGPTLSVEEIPGPAPEPEAEPTEEQMTAWRAASPNGTLFRATFPDGSSCVFAPMPRALWRSVQTRLDKNEGFDAALAACQETLLWPPVDLASRPAGHTEQLFEQILAASGFDAEPVVVEL